MRKLIAFVLFAFLVVASLFGLVAVVGLVSSLTNVSHGVALVLVVLVSVLCCSIARLNRA